jgi:hypothetical protein
MKLTNLSRIALAIAAALVCGGVTQAQDVKSSWLLRAPEVSSLRVLDRSAVRIDRAQRQLSDPQAPGGSDTAQGSNSSSNPTPRPPMVVPAGAPCCESREPVHRFWDTTNDLLFAGVGASRTLDYFSTLNMRRRGRQEILLTNDVVDNHAAFAVIEAAGTGASIGVSYLFHHYGHHKLERATSIVHIGLATTGAVRNYCLKTAHPATASPVSAMSALTPAIAPVIGLR